MAKLIIEHDDCISAASAINHVRAVVNEGFQSMTVDDIPHYCWVTTFNTGVVVFVRRKRRRDSADSFLVMRDKRQKGEEEMENDKHGE